MAIAARSGSTADGPFSSGTEATIAWMRGSDLGRLLTQRASSRCSPAIGVDLDEDDPVDDCTGALRSP